MQPALRIPADQIRAYRDRYDYEVDPNLSHIREAAKTQRHITRRQLHEIAQWKSKRRAALVNENDEGFVREITEFAFRASHEHSRIGALVLLAGVHYPTASVVLRLLRRRHLSDLGLPSYLESRPEATFGLHTGVLGRVHKRLPFTCEGARAYCSGTRHGTLAVLP